MLLAIFENAPQASRQVDIFRWQYPGAKGRLAGHDAQLRETLTALAEASAGWRKPYRSPDWATFSARGGRGAGGAHENRRRGRAVAPGPAQDAGNRSEFFHSPRGRRQSRAAQLFSPGRGRFAAGQQPITEIRAYNIPTGKPAWGSDKDAVIYRDEEFSAGRHMDHWPWACRISR